MAASVWFNIAKRMIDRGVMSEVALDTLLRIKKITNVEHVELLAMWIAKIEPEEPTDGEVDAPSGTVNSAAGDAPDGSA